MAEKVTIRSIIAVDARKVWEFYTEPEHITQWNFASDDWHCPSASNDLRPGGTYSARMEARDGSFGFDFEAVYDAIIPGESIHYTMGDGRQVIVTLKELGGATDVTVTFDAETENDVELQRQGWQAILNNFTKYAESH